MFCRFCGKQIDPSLRLCPECGERQADRCGGNGFWDILSSKGQLNSMEKGIPEDVEKTAIPMKQMRKANIREPSKRQRLALALSLLCLLYAITSNVVLSMRIQTLEKEIKTVVEERKPQADYGSYLNTRSSSSEHEESTTAATIAETKQLETEPEAELSPIEEQADDFFQEHPLSESSDSEQRN